MSVVPILRNYLIANSLFREQLVQKETFLSTFLWERKW